MPGIDGIVTGYEDRFDFPLVNGLPPVRYLLASVPRAGSTWLSHQLWGTGCLGAPLEYCNFEPGGPGGVIADNPDAQISVWRQSLQRRTSPNGVYGLKVFPAMLHQLQTTNPALLSEVMRVMAGPQSPRKLVRLRRRDAQAHAISYARASLSGIWRQEQEGATDAIEPDFSALAFERCQRALESQERAWDAMCADLRIEPLELWFEDALADPAATVLKVSDYLGVQLDPGAAIPVPEIRRQAQGGARVWAEKLSQE